MRIKGTREQSLFRQVDKQRSGELDFGMMTEGLALLHQSGRIKDGKLVTVCYAGICFAVASLHGVTRFIVFIRSGFRL